VAARCRHNDPFLSGSAGAASVAVQMGGDRRPFPSAGQRRPWIPRRPCLAFAVCASWPAQWSRATDRWVILHVFAQACLDSFACYLNEAADATSISGPVWMPFPVVDFPEREWVVLAGDLEENGLRLVIAPASVCPNTKTGELQVGHKHYQQHSNILNRDVAPTEWLAVPAGRRRATNLNGARKSTDPLLVDRKGSVGVTAMALAVFAASDSE
jgi:hypothetical protein